MDTGTDRRPHSGTDDEVTQKQTEKQTKQPRWQIESGTRGVYVGSTYAERSTNWPLFTWSPDPARIIRFDDREAAETELYSRPGIEAPVPARVVMHEHGGQTVWTPRHALERGLRHIAFRERPSHIADALDFEYGKIERMAHGMARRPIEQLAEQFDKPVAILGDFTAFRTDEP
jgi:hypothetical protein